MPIQNFTTHPMLLLQWYWLWVKHLTWKTTESQLWPALTELSMLQQEKDWFINFTKQVFIGTLVTFLHSFLSNKFSRNLANGYISDGLKAISDFLRGSILSPVLFLVFSGDLSADPAKSNLQLPNCLSKHPPNKSKYADDYKLCNNIKQLEELQWDLNVIMQWCQKWRININIQQTRIFVFENKNKKLQNWIHSTRLSDKTSQRKNRGHYCRWKTHTEITFWHL